MTPELRRLLDRARAERVREQARATPAERMARLEDLYRTGRALRPGVRGGSDEPPELLLALARRRRGG